MYDQNPMDPEKYDMCYHTGCMLKDPLEQLPPYFEIWNELVVSLPTLIQEKRLREEVNKMPLLDHSRLEGYTQLRLAHLQLSFLTAGYVWQDGDKGVAQVLPQCLAIPLYRISQRLDMQPILSHGDLVLANWSLIDPTGPYDLENFKCHYHLPGGKASDWFCIVTFMVEFSFAKALKPVFRILDILDSQQCLEKDSQVVCVNMQEICQCLGDVSQVLQAMQNSLARMHDNLSAKDFFNVIRPLLSGWGGEGNPLPDGLIYEGISKTPIKMTGGSAAQSTSLQVIDALLGVEHTADKREFLLHMRSFMPPDHRRLIKDLEQRSYKLLDLVTSTKDRALESAYDQCLSALIDLRNYHIQIVKKYIIIPSKKFNEGNFESLDSKGTGGTSLIPFLKDLLSDTERKLLSSSTLSGATNGRGSWPKGSYLLAGAVLVSLALIVRRVILQS